MQFELKNQLDLYFAGREKFIPAHDVLMQTAASFLGLTLSNAIDTVNLMRRTIGTAHDEPWCVAFVQTCVAYVEAAQERNSPLAATEGALDLWHRSPLEMRVTSPQAGDLIIWQMGPTPLGHCGIITSVDTLTYQTIEGNTSPGVGIIRDGNGVYAKKRIKGGSNTFIERGFLRCFP